MHVVALSSAATIGHAAAGRVDIALVAAVLAGGVPGVLVGARLATSVPERSLRTGLAIVLLMIGFQLTFFGVSHGTSASFGGSDS